MTAACLIAALHLPEGARIDQRVPKKLLMENGALTAADRRHITEGIDELYWLAALKPTTVGIPEYCDDVRDSQEIAVLRLAVRADAKASRLMELVHRAVPYPVLLITEGFSYLAISLAHKRWSQGDAGKVVLDGDVVSAGLYDMPEEGPLKAFLAALALAMQPRASLHALYQGWLDTVLALEAARVTGTFAVATSAELAAARRDALQECARLEAKIASLRAAAKKEKQLHRQVELNLELKRVQGDYAAARANL
jgi:hypothetical protein